MDWDKLCLVLEFKVFILLVSCETHVQIRLDLKLMRGNGE
jgi:hypothetical protein